MSPRVSVVVPAYNAAQTIASTVRSVLQQTEPIHELLVVDDGSTDATAEVVAAIADDRVRLLRQSNAGPAAARNRGLAFATGHCVAFLDADDLWLPGHLASVRDALDSHGAGMAFADAWVLDHDTGRIRRTSAMAHQLRSPVPRDRDRLVRALLRRNFVVSSTIVRREVLDRVGGFRTDLKGTEDYELWLRIATAGYSFAHVPERLWIHREISGSISDDLPRMVDALRRVYDIVLATYSIDASLRDLARTRRDECVRLHTSLINPATRSLEERAIDLTRALQRRLRSRRLWLARSPADVETLLVDVGDPSVS